MQAEMCGYIALLFQSDEKKKKKQLSAHIRCIENIVLQRKYSKT